MRIGLLGPLEVRTGEGEAVEVAGARVRALLSALALEAGREVSAGRLVDAVWGERPPATANALQALVSRLRRAGVALESTSVGYRLEAEVDVARFEELVARGRRTGDAEALREALELWRGPALVDVADGEYFQGPIARLTELRLSAVEDHAEAVLRLGRGEELTGELAALLQEHPLRERLAAALMRALHAAGRPAEALTVYERLRKALVEELGADPSAQVSAVHTAILRDSTVDTVPEEVRTNLRAGLTSFVGRDADVAQVGKLVAEYRLTTLTGPGGAGKTRLATETARTLLDQTTGDTWLVELAPITDGADVAQAVVTALDAREQGQLSFGGGATSAERAVQALRGREALLVLDNCEHVIDAAAELAERLLGECPRLRILATSREPLAVTGEALWPVEPLALPPEGASVPEAMACASVRLLADRAAAVRPGFEVDPSTVGAVTRICRALDGMPLAVELAAARLRSLTVPQLAARLDDRFRLLTGGSRTALPRHRTLRAVVDWSWELLSDAERTLLRRLAFFSGGATAEAAAAVSGVEDAPDLLMALVDKSLLVVSDSVEPRYGMLETIKAYAFERLDDAGEREQVRRAHAEWFAQFAETADPHLRRAEQLEWLVRLAADHGNLTAAVRGSIAAGDAATALRLVVAAGWYWLLGGHKAEGQELIVAALGVPGEADVNHRAAANAFAVLFVTAGIADDSMADEWTRAAVELSAGAEHHHPLLRFMLPLQELLSSGRTGARPRIEALDELVADEDPWIRAQAYQNRFRLQLNLGHGHAAAEADAEESVRLFRLSGERWGLSLALTNLAELTARRGDFHRATDQYREAIHVVTEIGTLEDVLWVRARLAQLYWLMGDVPATNAELAAADRDAAAVAFPDALAGLALARGDLARWRGEPEVAGAELDRAEGLVRHLSLHPLFRAMLLQLRGFLAADAGDLDAAATMRREVFELTTAGGDVVYLAHAVVAVADHALRVGMGEEAARLMATAEVLRGGPDLSLPDAVATAREVETAQPLETDELRRVIDVVLG
ncbi:BTAD domain-containing putative transcriptional regulator [Amycolatopsis sp. FDAARGOS 1241]|uniref:BTAD domain-containing putative transcriptional regulator n=1 Tax=Amycolatopsis sp. FDAARGOS 1241 TaxID=2778070 RepID=UPI00194EC52B|nr:BTAD domain-containing putative transcriptional regulator [Amycolatopsis sp. FDAARGOS 1241]QRP44831.1 winged helix-turn-helix domain-containing protein [Amycolatopsis sp. FDAARGOS 1241]